jgi:hypothetical protein
VGWIDGNSHFERLVGEAEVAESSADVAYVIPEDRRVSGNE